jgi:hypothetical protein
MVAFAWSDAAEQPWPANYGVTTWSEGASVCVGLTGTPPAGVVVRMVYELHVIGFASAPSALGLTDFRASTASVSAISPNTTCVLLPLSGGATGFGVASMVHSSSNVRPVGLWLIGVGSNGATYCTRESVPGSAPHAPFAVSVLAAYAVIGARQNFATVQSHAPPGQSLQTAAGLQGLEAPLPFGVCMRAPSIALVPSL